MAGQHACKPRTVFRGRPRSFSPPPRRAAPHPRMPPIDEREARSRYRSRSPPMPPMTEVRREAPVVPPASSRFASVLSKLQRK